MSNKLKFSHFIIQALILVSLSPVSHAGIFDVPPAPATRNHHPIKIQCDIAIAGGGIGGTTAAIAAARDGSQVCLFSETTWLGGMLTSAGVSGIDGAEKNLHGIFHEFVTKVQDYYKHKPWETKKCAVSYLCFEPAVGNRVLKKMVKSEPNIKTFYNSQFTEVFRQGRTINGFQVVSQRTKYDVTANVTIDATDWGDLIALGNISHDLGPDKGSREPLAKKTSGCIQPLTHTAILQWQPYDQSIPKPHKYDETPFECSIPNQNCPKSNTKFSMDGNIFGITKYAALPNNKILINIPSHSYGNDFHATHTSYDDKSRNQIINQAKQHTLGYIYYLQTVHGMNNWGLSHDFDTNDQLAQIPYVRESRRIHGVKRLTETDITRRKNQPTSIATGSYPIDLHFCEPGTSDIYRPVKPYQIPYEVLIPKNTEGFLAGTGRTISVSHIVNGTTRLQQVESYIGQAAGLAASIASTNNQSLKQINTQALQAKILASNGRIAFVANSHLRDPHFRLQQIQSIINSR